MHLMFGMIILFVDQLFKVTGSQNKEIGQKGAAHLKSYKLAHQVASFNSVFVKNGETVARINLCASREGFCKRLYWIAKNKRDKESDCCREIVEFYI